MSSSAFPSLMALRQTLRRSVAVAPSHLAASTSASASAARTSSLHTTSSRTNAAVDSQPSTSSSSSPSSPASAPIASSSAPASSSSSGATPPDATAAASANDGHLNLDSLHAEFGFEPNSTAGLFADMDSAADVIAVPTKPSLVHVRLSYLSPSTKPLRPVTASTATTAPAPAAPETASADATATGGDASASTSSSAPDSASPSAADVASTSTVATPVPTRIRRPSPRYVPLSSHVFDAPARRDVLHSAVVYYLDAQRSGTASTKTRSDVRGSKKKLRPQKGSGQARLGTMSNPILRGGAVAHGPRPRDHSTQLPRRVRELALRSALSARWREGNLIVVPSFDWMPPPGSTGPLARLLAAKKWTDALFLSAPRNPSPSTAALSSPLDRPSSSDPVYTKAQRREHTASLRNFALSSSNLPRIELIELDALTEEARENAKTEEEKKRPGELHAYEVLKRQKVICDLGAIEWLEEKLGGAIWHEQAQIDGLILDRGEGGIESQSLRQMEEELDQQIVDAATANASAAPTPAPAPAAAA
ncbi:uncharacterized protein PFL1_04943 [Pseudozyma flocculosa PF-1]|uniref:Large ribosomal subunit protein uL4m n=2 Tax=Pseudozyma flocculosa TaxID=84751 RepID=A0A5C3EWM8_9BASI|nr:uncharacterized protein PFL1_04943 [Pseudozyma flocculosa PF-1]EPQ27405.1 hypothetical protein PFL1_04943 [Pseudozyma flocculosa PF-1]SPO36175.1 related to 50S ribosomal protein L4 [Pseudozyma flocculosa]